MRVPVIAAAAAAVSLAACAPRPAEPPPAPAAPPPVVRPLPTAPAPADWRDRPATPGTWRYRRDPRGSVAVFGPPGGDALLTLRCDAAARRIELSRAGGLPVPLTIRTTSVSRVLPVQSDGAAPRAILAPADPLLDAVGFSRGRFAVEQAGSPPLAIPAWAEIERVTEDCRG